MSTDRDLASPRMVFLETPRLVLRRFTMHDVELIVELDSDPEVMRYISGGLPTAREEVEAEILPAWLAYYERFTGLGFWATHEKSSGSFIGWFHFRPPPGRAADDVELGYRLRRSAWGNGYATEGSRALIARGFTELGVSRVFARTMAINVASRRVMEKAGLNFVGIVRTDWPIRIPGDEHGEAEYALTREQWQARFGAAANHGGWT